MSHGGKVAVLRIRNLPLIETFEFGSTTCIPGEIDCAVLWKAIESPVERGFGTSVLPDDPGAFTGHFAQASCVAKASAREIGFSFRTGKLTAEDFFAEIGPERNGVFL